MKYEKIINIIILIKLLKWHYTSFLYCYSCFETIFIYTDIYVFKKFQCVLQF